MKRKSVVTVPERVAELVAEHGSYRAAGAAVGIDFALLHKLALGKKRAGGVTLRTLGLDPSSGMFGRLTRG